MAEKATILAPAEESETQDNDRVCSRGVMGPLMFPMHSDLCPSENWVEERDAETPCMLCDEEFKMETTQKDFLKHLFYKHRLVIADSSQIACMRSYAIWWRLKLRSCPLETFCSTLLMDVTPEGTPMPEQKYYLLSDVDPEDRTLRQQLQQRRLDWVLKRQQWEREDRSFVRECLFCRQQFEFQPRAAYFDHLSRQHNLNLGRPDNIVFGDQFIDLLEEKLNRLQCLFCEKTFKDRTVLKEHMRKKQHKQINPNNTEYDRFYVINYLEMGKTWHDMEEEQDDETDVIQFDDDPTNKESAEWSDWKESEDDQRPVCLFCDQSEDCVEDLQEHMLNDHKLDILSAASKEGLGFYEKLKIVNYVRFCMQCKKCITCPSRFSSRDDLMKHYESDPSHMALPSRPSWDQPEFFFPTYENDALLCFLDVSITEDDVPVSPNDPVVVPEDVAVPFV